MDVSKMLNELKAERTAIEEAILVMERLATGAGKRRGRPPAWMKAVGESAPVEVKRRGRKKGSRNKTAPTEG